ncbi:GNAT family N-acetyltransferase [Pseudomonas sp.]|uniref:GNAT family N-acetyltransferase n=1 Tax=Pseudomonas sp. TaxID=306 RepID=UPI002733D034|nr:GNAT family N-acetyltransferase [Pseudomonas sp.]MDP3815713.1 GNAT family N-acetyltransferase [Pseudomonas sp.]
MSVKPTSQHLLIQPAQESDAPSVAEMIQGVAHYFLATPSAAGAEGFLASLSPAAIASYINSPDFIYVLGFIEGELVGVAALRDNQHIYHLFVRPNFHRLGIANRLWQQLKSQAIAAGNTQGFTVNSSLFAVPVYAGFGFRPTGEAQAKNGIHFQPMHCPAGT